MTTLIAFSRNTLFLICLCFTVSCNATNTDPEIVLVGSTPGDESIKSMLLIPTGVKVDFIRWDLKLDHKNAFVLNITYGESQPNTLGFKGDGQKQTINGTYSITKNQLPNGIKEVYQLKSHDLSQNISMAKLNENLFHILSLQNHLMIGNGGWSYTLNRKYPVDEGRFLIASAVSDAKSSQLVFVGRTPCQEIADEHPEMKASPACFKLKWKLVLNRDAVTYEPTTCIIRKVVDNQARDVSGKWSIIRGTATNPGAIIYKIEFEEPAESISLLAGDDNVLFFLNRRDEPYTGNKDFSFTLNKKLPE